MDSRDAWLKMQNDSEQESGKHGNYVDPLAPAAAQPAGAPPAADNPAAGTAAP